MILLEAKPVSDQIRSKLLEKSAVFLQKTGRKPKIVVVLVGADAASVVYTDAKQKKAKEVGFSSEILKFPESATSIEVAAAVQKLNEDPTVDGILIQRPLPKNFREDDVLYWVHPQKDVDGFHPENVGKLPLGLPCLKACTPSGVMVLLDHYGITLESKEVLVIGRSSIVGKPLAALALAQNATLIHAHSKTKDLARWVSTADIVIAAVGKPHFISASQFKSGATAIDVGIHRTHLAGGPKLIGDIDPQGAESHLRAMSPVPGGVGPMTIIMLLVNTLISAEFREGRRAKLDTPIRSVLEN